MIDDILHEEIIRYVRFLRDKSVSGAVSDGLLASWYCFSEVRQNWLGFSRTGNAGSGLGMDFAKALHANLNTVFSSFGTENVTRSSHLEKLCLIRSGVGRDNISDFTTNLIKAFLLEYTQEFACKFLKASQRRSFAVARAVFNYETESWETRSYELPFFQNDFVILTPKDLLTRDVTWINRPDMIHSFEEVSDALPDGALRAQVNHYFHAAVIEKAERQGHLGGKS